MKYLYLIFRIFKCPHKWEIKHKFSVYRNGSGFSEWPYGEYSTKIHVLTCTKCNKSKKEVIN